MSTTIEPDGPIHERPSLSSSSPDLESGDHPTQGLTGIFRQVSLLTSQQPFVFSSSAIVCTSRCALRLVPVSYSRHRDIHPLWLLHRQLCRLCPSSASWLPRASLTASVRRLSSLSYSSLWTSGTVVCVVSGFGLVPSLIIMSECCWSDSRWFAFLEPGPLLELPHGV